MYKFLLIILIPISIFATENKNALKLGIILGGNYVQNETKLPIIDGDTCCGEFDNGNATSFYTGLSLNYEILPSFLSADVRFLFDSRPATLTANTNDYEVYNSTLGIYEKALVKNDFNATLNYFVFDIGAKIIPLESIPIGFRLGFDISDASITKKYNQTRQLIEPSGILLNGRNSETVSEGDFDNLNVSQGISGTLLADFQLSDMLTVSPEVTYRYPLNSSLEDIDWFTTLIRAGATISIRLNTPEKVDEFLPIIDTTSNNQIEIVQKEEEIIEERFDVIKTLSIDNLNLLETVVTQTYPILPYIFFDSASSDLNDKYYYKGDARNFSEQKLDKNSLKIYERLLDLVGSRLVTNSQNIKLIGFTDGKEIESIMERKSLAYNRANSIKNYLIQKWNISTSKISIETADIPTQPTNTFYSEGLEENRRVEIVPENINILKPIVHSQFLEYATDKKTITINFDADFEKIEDYTLILSDDKNQLYSETKSTPPNRTIKITVNDEFQKKLGSSDLKNLKVEIIIKRTDGRIETKSSPFMVNKENNNFELGRLNLIVFDFDKSVISESNKNMIDKFIINNISENSNIDVIGSTDILGEKIYNKQLSEKRANNVADYINTLLPDIKFNKISGIGSDNPKFSNSSPEGRFYCRTVLIEVKTPINID